MYGIFTYIYHKNQPNVGTYTIHGWYGLGGVSAYVLGGFFTEGVSITKTMFFYIFSLQWSNSILSVTDCFRFFPIISDSSFAPKNKKNKKCTNF